MSNLLSQLVTSVPTPEYEVFKIGPDAISELISKLLVAMGATPTDIEHVEVLKDKSNLKIRATVVEESNIFASQAHPRTGLALLGAFESHSSTELCEQAKDALKEVGLAYRNQNGRMVYLVTIEEVKHSIQLSFNPEVVLAILTDSNYADTHFTVDPSEEVVRKKKHSTYQFKGKKKVLVFAKVHRTVNAGAFEPEQVGDWLSNGEEEDGDDD